MRFLFSLAAIALTLSACSIYRSDGRKFLEKRAYEYSGVEAYREYCAGTAETTGLNVIGGDSRAQLYALAPTTESSNRMRVVPLGDRPYSCDYGFTTPEQMTSLMDPAIGLTVHLQTSGN